MRYLSVCSGIEAASVAFGPHGWEPVAFSEIDRAASSVLEHHYPGVPNWGDMSKFQEWPDADVDVLCGGTPCQSFSIAGLRKGLADPRGNLTLTFLSVAKKYRPQYIVWENVPGVLSDKDDALGMFMSGLNELGYAIDCDILDAQYFGLAQRRRRVFFVCHNIAIGRQKRTPLFANATGQFLSELLLSVLAEASDPSRLGADISAWPARLTRRGLHSKMTCFGAPSLDHLTEDGLTTWLARLASDWVEVLALSGNGRANSVSGCAPSDHQAGVIPDEGSSDSTGMPLSLSTEQSWRSTSAALCDLMSMSTISTATRTTTTSEIYTCARLSLSIVQSIIRSTTSPQNYFDGDGSGLTALRAFTNYARQAASDLFGNLDGLCDWLGFVTEAERALCELGGSLGDRACTGTLFSDSEGLRWYSPPRREAGKGIAADVAQGVAIRGREGGGTAELTGPIATALRAAQGGGDKPHVICANSGDVGYCLTASSQQSLDAETETETLIAEPVAHALRGDGFDASEDGTGRGTPLIAIQERAVSENTDAGPQGAGWRDDGAAYTLEARHHVQAVAFAHQAGGKQTTLGATNDGTCQTLGACQTPAIATPYAVRRLTPRECERLMGFPDDYTLVPNGRGGMQADGPRYKQLGNSWAINCVDWIAERIAIVDQWGAVPEQQEQANG